jgi:Fe-S cluster assembly protein SufD
VKLKDKLIQAYKDGATLGLSFESERAKHIQQLEEMGFPTIKDEEWKYTNLLPILKKDYQLSESISKVNSFAPDFTILPSYST